MSRSPYDYPTGVRRVWAGFEMFRRLGFSAHDIYFTTARSALHDGAPAAVVLLRTQGKVFNIIAETYGTMEAATAALEAFVEFGDANDKAFDHDEMMNIYFATLAEWGGALAFTKAVLAKGFQLSVRKEESEPT